MPAAVARDEAYQVFFFILHPAILPNHLFRGMHNTISHADIAKPRAPFAGGRRTWLDQEPCLHDTCSVLGLGLIDRFWSMA